MNTKFVFKSLFSIALIAFVFASCDKDFNSIGSNLIDGNHFDFEKDSLSTVVAYTQATGPVQTNYWYNPDPSNPNTAVVNVNPLGLLHNNSFSKTKANFVTQVQLSSLSPVFGKNIVVDSVRLVIPYFSKKTATSATGQGTYTLDSIFGSAPIKLSVYESGYYVNDLDPSEDVNFQSELKFYNDDSRFENYRKGATDEGTPVFNGNRLNNSAIASQNDSFVFSNKETVLKTPAENEEDDDVITRSAPAMRLNLNKEYFKKRIIEAPADKLSNHVRFKEYFRGIYFKAEQSAADPEGKGTLAMMDFTKGNITISYSEDIEVTKDSVVTVERVQKSVTLNFTGHRISLLEESNLNTDYQNALTSAGPDTANGDEKLYLKGGQGAMTIINLFGKDLTGDPVTGLANGVPDELDALRENGWLINEANLTFYVDTDNVNEIYEPQRIYLYDLNNKRPLYDYSIDGSINISDTKKNRGAFGGILAEETKNGGTKYKKYKIRITKYIDNLINKDSTNVRLGLVLTEGINEIKNNRLKTTVTLEDGFKLDRIPVASVLNPLGTILWGSTPAVPQDKRLRLEIFYTKPTN